MKAHHMVIRDGKIANYHPYPPTPWNGSPTDSFGTPGPYEDAVMGQPIFEENGPDEFRGQYTCIQHGGGVATCYAHQSSIGVGTGASVKQGQVIGSVGCTGHCFGDHVHFEVRINGSPVDPMGYL